MEFQYNDAIKSESFLLRVPLMDNVSIQRSHWHDHYEIVIVEEGCVCFFVEGNPISITLEKNDMILIFPNILHFPCKIEGVANSVQVLDFRASYISDIADNLQILNPSDEPFYYVYTAKLSDEMSRSLSCFADHIYLSNTDTVFRRALFYAVLGIFNESGVPVSTSIGSTAESEQHIRIKNVCSYISNNLGSDISIETLSAVANYSESHLYKLFRKIVGQTIKEYTEALRVSEIRRLLGTGKLSVSEISNRLGFSHPNNMGRMYKRITGENLGDYQKDPFL